MATEDKAIDSDDDAGERQTIVVDLGKQKRRRIKQLRRGKGRLMRAVDDLIEQIENSDETKGEILPIVVVVRERRKKRKFLDWI